MSLLKKHAASARVIAVIAMSGLALSSCATNDYVDQQIATVNSRIDQLDGRVTTAAQRAEAANQAAQAAASSAQSANQAAQAAATDARTANQRLDQLGGRVDALEKPPAPRRTPRG
jgi:outer membrane murein-binding lipoprotein Lpp